MTQETPTGARRHTPLQLFNMILFSVCAIMLLSQFTMTAQIGPTSIFWTIVIIVLFFIPYGLITSELGSTYPDAGGIYSWVVRAFGTKWGTRVSWWYWVNVALWVPSVYFIFAGTLSQLFFGGNLNFWVQIAIALVLIWVNYWINSRRLETGAWVSNLGAGITMAVTAVLVVVAIVFGIHNGSATQFTIHTMLPTGSDTFPAIAMALPIIIYNFLGFELMSSASLQMRNPKKDVPRAIITAAVLIGLFYLLATISMQVIQGADDIDTTTGLIGSLQVALGSSTAANVFIGILSVGALYCFFACLIPWTIGANMAAAEASQRGDLPAFFGRSHPRFGTPTGAALLTSIVGTIVTIIFAILSSATNGSINDVFWNLFWFSSVIFLLPYIVLMLVFLRLRKIDANARRPYRVPGGDGLIKAMAWIPLILLALSVVFFIVNPFDFDWTATVPILIGCVIVVVIEEVLVKRSRNWVAVKSLETVADTETAEVLEDAKK